MTRLEQFAQAFETDKRPDGETFVRLKDDSPDWMTDIIRTIHGDMMPDDTKYSMISEVADTLGEYERDSWDDCAHEICDGLVEIYNHGRIKWLESHLTRAYYCDEAQEQGLLAHDSDMFTRLGVGQFMEYQEIVYFLMAELQDDEANDVAA